MTNIMFALERIRIIKNYLKENYQAEVASLSDMLNVSEVTIRRDLEKLEREGFLSRTHGGAILKEAPSLTIPVEGPAGPDNCSEIAEFALHMVEHNDRVMLVSGMITRELAKQFKRRKGLTVLTNDIAAAVEISSQESNRVILLGGDISGDHTSLFGPLTLGNLRRFNVHRLFFEADGISDQLHLSVDSQEKADIIEAAMEISQERIALCCADHFGESAFYHLGGITLAQRIITNPSLSDEYKHQLFGSGIQLFTSVNVFEGHV